MYVQTPDIEYSIRICFKFIVSMESQFSFPFYISEHND